ncbi:MAG: hypothetical protein U0836_07825 [Pirellulales bacterium]
MMKVRFWALVGLLTFANGPARAADFSGLGFLPGDTQTSSAGGVSADGSVVVGTSYTGGYRWTVGGGMTPVDGLSDAVDVSADGQSVLGHANSAARTPVTWTPSGVTTLAPLWGPTEIGAARANAISADGKVVAGRALHAIPEVFFPAYWPHPTTGIKLSYEGKFTNGDALDLSADGSVMVGEITVETPERSYLTAFRWTESEGIVPLSAGGGFSSSIHASAVSEDGKVIVGTMTNDIGLTQAYRWTQETGAVPLPDLPGGGGKLSASAVSGEGSTIVGTGLSESGTESFIWTSQAGTRSLVDVLKGDYNLGAALQGWSLLYDFDISADGSTVIGTGKNPQGQTEAWRATLVGEWPPGDANFDGRVSLDDFGILKANFGLGIGENGVAYRAQGNFDGDRDVDLSDFGLLKGWFGGGAGVLPVPEPASGLLAVLAAVGGAVLCWRRPQDCGTKGEDVF